MNDDIHDHSDIISLPRPVSKRHKPMSRAERAAQFAPFAALNGYEESIEEEGRELQKRMELSSERREEIGRILFELDGERNRKISVRFFRKDRKKEGGTYLKKEGVVKTIDGIKQKVVFCDGEEIEFADIYDIDTNRKADLQD